MPDWPHAPIHKLSESGAYMVTGGTYQKQHHLHDAERLDFFRDTLVDLAKEFGWHLQAWAVLANHYHFIAVSPDGADSLSTFLSKLHMLTAKELNRRDDARGHHVWYQFWDSHITYQRSYLARLNYVDNNPVHHGVVEAAIQYPWRSAAWFESCAPAAFQKTVGSFKTDRLNVVDDF